MIKYAQAQRPKAVRERLENIETQSGGGCRRVQNLQPHLFDNLYGQDITYNLTSIDKSH